MYKVLVEKGTLNFSAAHFISFAGKCERLHGHNYAVSAELVGELTEDRYVVDFVVLKRIVREICDRLDHHFLLPMDSTTLQIQESDGEWEIRFEDRRYVLPAQDVLPVPLDNITAERLASYICDQLVAELHRQAVDGAQGLSSITVGVEECPGQTAFYQRSLAAKAH
jgi:6-pyruvoyltetrahydropterin/6-carboxytetrahydropterin synthase